MLDEAVASASQHYPVDPVAMHLVFNLKTVTESILADLKDRLQGAGASSIRVLNTLMLLSARTEVDQRALMDFNGLSKAGVSYLVEQMVKDGLVTRRAAPEDRRTVRLRITDLGRDALAKDLRLLGEGELAWAETLDIAEREELLRLLAKLRDRPEDAGSADGVD